MGTFVFLRTSFVAHTANSSKGYSLVLGGVYYHLNYVQLKIPPYVFLKAITDNAIGSSCLRQYSLQNTNISADV